MAHVPAHIPPSPAPSPAHSPSQTSTRGKTNKTSSSKARQQQHYRPPAPGETDHSLPPHPLLQDLLNTYRTAVRRSTVLLLGQGFNVQIPPAFPDDRPRLVWRNRPAVGDEAEARSEWERDFEERLGEGCAGLVQAVAFVRRQVKKRREEDKKRNRDGDQNKEGEAGGQGVGEAPKVTRKTGKERTRVNKDLAVKQGSKAATDDAGTRALVTPAQTSSTSGSGQAEDAPHSGAGVGVEPLLVVPEPRKGVKQEKQRREPVLPRPTSDRRTHEIAQLARRFNTTFKQTDEDGNGTTTLSFCIPPTDPAFPFDMEALHLELSVPKSYPSEPSTIRVLNEGFPEVLDKRVRESWRVHGRSSESLLKGTTWVGKEMEAILRGKIKAAVEEPKESLEPKLSIITVVKPRRPSTAVRNAPRVAEEVLRQPVRRVVAREETNALEAATGAVEVGTSQTQSGKSRMSLPAESLPKAGVQVRLSKPRLSNISVVELQVLPLVLRCSRCKTVLQKPLPLQPQTATSTTCHQCKEEHTAMYYKQLVHEFNHHLGVVQTHNCVPHEVRGAVFVATCAECGEVQPPWKPVTGGTIQTYGCRNCHKKMDLAFEQIHFVVLGTSEDPALANLKTKHIKTHAAISKSPYDDMIAVGKPLPSTGACKHYKRSHRWFRFPCCNKVYPCDDCHASAEDHEVEWARRMICGFCGRESAVKEECVCGGNTVGGTSKGGFWEGGKGVRDPARMSRKDPRKGRLMKKQAEMQRKPKK